MQPPGARITGGEEEEVDSRKFKVEWEKLEEKRE
jgi:hypothetical protein